MSIDGKLRPLEEPFFVIATQNPVESRGTYPLPEAQMDRFALKFSLGYVTPEDEVGILTDQRERHPIESISPCMSREDVLGMTAEKATVVRHVLHSSQPLFLSAFKRHLLHRIRPQVLQQSTKALA